jgi:hypothetical protein
MMLIASILISCLGAYFIYFGIDTILYMGTNIWYALLGAAYAIGGMFLIGSAAAETCDHYGWFK